jgi:gliding motility-associated-like protein
MRNFVYCILLIFCMKVIVAQNLVPNYSFEQYDTCPYLGSQLHFAKPWFSPTDNTPDYFNSCSPNYNVPNAGGGWQEAFDGNAYAGIYLVEYNNVGTEYIAVKLVSKLEQDSVYCISFRMSLGEGEGQYCTIEKVGLYISSDSVHQASLGYLHFTPQIFNEENISDPTIWYDIRGYYKAEGGEEFLYIGNFDSTGNIVSCNYSNHGKLVYAYVDYISVQKSVECHLLHQLTNLPNIITPNGDGINDFIEIPIANTVIRTYVYNRWGSLIFEYVGSKVFWDGTGNGTVCSDGVYYMLVQFDLDGKPTKKYTVIQLFN